MKIILSDGKMYAGVLQFQYCYTLLNLTPINYVCNGPTSVVAKRHQLKYTLNYLKETGLNKRSLGTSCNSYTLNPKRKR